MSIHIGDAEGGKTTSTSSATPLGVKSTGGPTSSKASSDDPLPMKAIHLINSISEHLENLNSALSEYNRMLEAETDPAKFRTEKHAMEFLASKPNSHAIFAYCMKILEANDSMRDVFQNDFLRSTFATLILSNIDIAATFIALRNDTRAQFIDEKCFRDKEINGKLGLFGTLRGGEVK